MHPDLNLWVSACTFEHKRYKLSTCHAFPMHRLCTVWFGTTYRRNANPRQRRVYTSVTHVCDPATYIS